MKHLLNCVLASGTGFLLVLGVAIGATWSEVAQAHEDEHHGGNLEELKELHRGHQHHHDFEAMEKLSPEETQRMLKLMTDIGLALPPMDSHRGRVLFVNKGCVVCHSVNHVGGEIGPSLDAEGMPQPMNAFEFAARMWRGAPAMAQMQEELLGEVISLSGQDLADLVAFAHDKHEQEELTAKQIPPRFSKLIEH